jgi:hypothetical protein
MAGRSSDRGFSSPEVLAARRPAAGLPSTLSSSPPRPDEAPARRMSTTHSRQNFAWGGFSCWHRVHRTQGLPTGCAGGGRDGGLKVARGLSGGQARLDRLAELPAAVVKGSFAERVPSRAQRRRSGLHTSTASVCSPPFVWRCVSAGTVPMPGCPPWLPQLGWA